MNNEIKEILQYLKDDSKSFIICGVSYYKITDCETKILLEYITNLQEENKTIRENNLSMQKEMCMSWKKSDDYKSRCEKAIKYINLTGYGTDFSMNAEEVDVLFNILKGENNDI